MTRQVFLKAMVTVVAVFGLLVFPNVLAAQGNSEAAFERVREVQEAHTDALMARNGVVGTAIGLGQGGQLAVVVLVERPGIAGIPAALDGVPVQVVVTGEIIARSQTKDRFDRPVPTGVSTGHPNITAGTIACRVKDTEGNVYALSNNHIYADENKASIGDNVLQPGPFDGGTDPADAIGMLWDFEPILFGKGKTPPLNTMDAAIALSSTVELDTSTPPDGYGIPNSTIVAAFITQKVQKFGRTTHLTHGEVTMVNATVDVNYGRGNKARFVDQVVIEPGDFSSGGDSGSLIVTDDAFLNPVGLLFAGSSSHTIANRIDLVLAKFGVTVDGGAGADPTLLNITTTSLSDGTVDALYSEFLSATGGTTPYTWTTSGSLPSGLNLEESTGEISGTATEAETQTFTVTVTDDTGATDSQALSITINTAPTGATTVRVASITYATEGGKNGDKHLLITIALLDNLDAPVGGASVSITLSLGGVPEGSGSGTTGGNGTTTFSLKNAKSGDYTTEVTNVTAAGLTWDGDGTTADPGFTK